MCVTTRVEILNFYKLRILAIYPGSQSTMTSIDISKISADDISVPDFGIDYNKEGKVWLPNQRDVDYQPFLINKKPLVVKFSGSLSTNGVNVNKFGDTENISIGVQVDDQVANGFAELEKSITNFLKEEKMDEMFEVTSPLKDDRIYIKLRYDSKVKKWVFKTNVSINHSKPQDANLFKGQGVTILCSVSAYASVKNMKIGIYVTPVSLTFAK